MSTPTAERPRLLLVDDSMLMRKAASKMLGDEFEIITAVDGVDGWEKIESDRTLQVIFTDLMMPRLDGYGLLQKVRASEDDGIQNLPLIVVTGAENDESARRRALDLGATDFITKPFSSVDLLARARAHANHRRIAQRLEQQVTVDALTGLANKTGFLDRLAQDIAFAQRHAQVLTLARVEIDDFRNVFLKRGKANAEALVQHVARVLHETVRKEDSAARIGLAGFALALPGGQHDGSRGLLERLRKKFADAPFVQGDLSLPFTVSVAVFTPHLTDALTAAAALESCETLVQGALRAGGNRVEARTDLEPAPVVQEKTAPVAAPAPLVQAKTAPVATPAPIAAAPQRAPVAKPKAEVESVALERVDEALDRIERGESQSVLARLPQLLKRLAPLFRLLNARQREQLIVYLQKLGG